MIVYCGLRHFYIRHFNPPQPDAYYILTHNKKVWDFSPALKDHGFTNQSKTTLYLDKPVLTLPINLVDFLPFAKEWHKFSQLYTEEIEVEYPHAWYLRFDKPVIYQQFISDFSQRLELEGVGGIWGIGPSKLVAKLAAHNRSGQDRIVTSEQTKEFLHQMPLHRFPLPEAENLTKLGIKTLGELASIPLTELSLHFGQQLAVLLEKLGRGEDLIPFQPQKTQEYRWNLDCTTLDGYLRPLSPTELRPYLEQGAEKLATTLKDQHKVAGQIKLRVLFEQGMDLERVRQLKEATDEAEVITRTVESLLPKDYIARLEIVASKLEASSLAQLTMFWEPQAPKVVDEELANFTQVGIELPRRERLLMLWEECLREQAH